MIMGLGGEPTAKEKEEQGDTKRDFQPSHVYSNPTAKINKKEGDIQSET